MLEISHVLSHGFLFHTDLTNLTKWLHRKSSQLVGYAECFHPDGTRECNDACFCEIREICVRPKH